MAVEEGERPVNAHLDTHVALWLVAGETRRLRPIRTHLTRATLFVSPFAVVEMEILREIGRIREPVAAILDILRDDHGVAEARGDLHDIAGRARLLAWTRDPFDRFIVAHALAAGATLLTADDTIRAQCPRARWDA